MQTRLLGAGFLVVACVMFGSVCWGAAEEVDRYGQPLQITAYDVTLVPDFDANVCHADAICRLRNFGTAPAQTASAFVLGPQATSTEVKGLEFQVQTAAGAWEKAPFTTTELPFASWVDEKLKVYRVSLPQPLQPQAETVWRATYTLSTTDPAESDIMPPLPADRRELVLLVDHLWLPTVPAGASYAFTRYGRDKNDIRYKPTWTIRVQAPTGCRAVAVSGETMGENIWRSRAPGYPMVFVGRYQLTTVEDSGIAVDIYSPPGARDDLTAIAHEIAEYCRIYTDAFGPLPGTRLNVLFTAHPDFVGHAGYLGFAMDQAIRGGPSSLAHELAHSWWGLSVSGYGVGTKFLEESLAEWSSVWAEKKLHGRPLPTLDPPDRWHQFGLLQESFGAGREFGGSRSWPRTGSPSIINLDPYGQVGDRDMAHTQGKGPGLLTEIMNTVGEAAFLKALRTYATMHQDGWCTLDDFIATLKDSTGRDFGPFFRERTVATGVDTRLHSFYVASGMRSYRKGAGWETEVTVLNKGTHETVCPIELQTSGGTVGRTIQVPPGAVRTVHFATDAQVKSLVIDPRWQALPVVGEKVWRGINLPSDDPWELARRMTPESMGGENWAWCLQALAFARVGQWQACAERITTYDSLYQEAVGHDHSSLSDLPVHAYLRGTAFLHLGKADKAAQDFPYVIDEVLLALSGGARPDGLQPLNSFEGAGIIAHTGDPVFTNHLLKLLTGQDFGFDPAASKEANAPAVARWQAWWKEHRSSYRVPVKLQQYPDLLIIHGA